jgi:4-hydroxy-3-polyprenylbenzoate decarboxylase
MNNPTKRPVVVGITGASGHLLGQRCIERLLHYGYEVLLVCTPSGRRVWREELDAELGSVLAGLASKGKITQFHVNDVGAPIASGGLVTHGMLVVPCSMGTLAAIAAGMADNLLDRAADVTLKEYRPLVVVPRETPLSAIHLENMLRLARIGVRIVPPMPAFYLKPQTIPEAVDQLVPRVLSALSIPEALDEPPLYRPAGPNPRPHPAAHDP